MNLVSRKKKNLTKRVNAQICFKPLDEVSIYSLVVQSLKTQKNIFLFITCYMLDLMVSFSALKAWFLEVCVRECLKSYLVLLVMDVS